MSGAVLITGATSGIGAALADNLGAAGTPLVLAGRDLDGLRRLADDLAVRHGAAVEVARFEARDRAGHAGLVRAAIGAHPGGLRGVVVCHGYLGPQELAERDPEEAAAVVEINYLSCVSLLEPAAAYLAERGEGFICGVSSVAGDRGRQSNYAYGAAKAGLSAYLQGLRQRLARHGVAVVTVKPGFVDTPMTYGREGMFLVATPERVARDVARAIRRRRNVIYTPWFWRWIMLVIRTIPEPIFKRLEL